MSRLGTVTLQSMDDADIFLTEDVYLDGDTDFAEKQTELQEPGFDEEMQYVSGRVPKRIPVEVEGDSSLISGWFRGENFSSPFYLRIYIEYEDVEEIMPEEEKP